MSNRLRYIPLFPGDEEIDPFYLEAKNGAFPSIRQVMNSVNSKGVKALGFVAINVKSGEDDPDENFQTFIRKK